MNQQIIQNGVSTPLGDMVVMVVDDSICLLEFSDRTRLPDQIQIVEKLYDSQVVSGDHPLFPQLQQELDEYFAGTRKSFDVPINYPGSEFQVKVWDSLLSIPYGKTKSYNQQSILLGNQKAIRAVAKANGDNRLAILIPCHRIIGSDGSLVGYSGKLWRKKHLLELEGALVKQGQLF